jgi:hypothetical protein
MWMNGYSKRDFIKQIEESQLRVISWNENQGGHAAYKVLRVLSKVPRAGNILTSNIYGVFEHASTATDS